MSLLVYVILGLLAVIGAESAAIYFERVRVVSANNRATAAELKVKTAEERATALALLWAGQVYKSDGELQKVRDEQATAFNALEERVKSLDDGVCVAGPDVEQLLHDIARAANAAGIAGVDQSGADSVSRSTGAGVTHR